MKKKVKISFTILIIICVTFILISNLNKVKVQGVNASLLGIGLIENNQIISYRNYNAQSDGWDEKQGALLERFEITEDFIPGKIYQERLAAQNTGGLEQYIRVTVYKNWANKEGEKVQYGTDLIVLNFTSDERWIIDESASTADRTVLYYKKKLNVDEITPDFIESFYIDSNIKNKVNVTTRKEGENTIITTERAFNGLEVCINVKIDAVQNHNVQDQIFSAWGRKVEVDANGDISLID